MKRLNKPEPAIAALLSTLGPPLIGITLLCGLHWAGIAWHWVLVAMLALSGLGHWYAGHPWRGAIVGVIGILIPYLVTSLLCQSAKDMDDFMGFIPVLGGMAASICWCMAAGIDASLIASRTKHTPARAQVKSTWGNS